MGGQGGAFENFCKFGQIWARFKIFWAKLRIFLVFVLDFSGNYYIFSGKKGQPPRAQVARYAYAQKLSEIHTPQDMELFFNFRIDYFLCISIIIPYYDTSLLIMNLVHMLVDTFCYLVHSFFPDCLKGKQKTNGSYQCPN